ncbi:MAG: type II toxin-antitoxin system Phd/YefM family antitoxin [Bacteroidetes bacterium]|nr:type II toxin-antitoxin system Phd/YefM family antitoxin [Bacteroidota bacterium]
MKTITLNDFYRDIRKHIRYVLNGEEIIVATKKKPLLFIEPVNHAKHRPFGLCKGEFIVPDNFNDILPDDIIAGFEGR